VYKEAEMARGGRNNRGKWRYVEKYVGRAIDLFPLHGYKVPPKLDLYGYTTKTPLD
jgi:hypothetical protein